MKKIKGLDHKTLRLECDPGQFDFETTQTLKDVQDIIGQQRALSAVHFGLGIKQSNFHIYAMGPHGVGKHTVIHKTLEDEAKDKSPPPDYCYVNNFDKPQKPLALRLPSGMGPTFKRDMKFLIEELRTSIPAALDSDEYRAQLQQIDNAFKEKQDTAFKKLEAESEALEVKLLRTAQGFAVAPTRKGEAMTPEQFESLPKEEQARREEALTKVRQDLTDVLDQIPRWHRERREKEKDLVRQFTMSAVGHLIDEMKKKYHELKSVKKYLGAVQDDVVENVKDFSEQPEKPPAMLLGLPGTEKPRFTRYQVNILVTHSKKKGIPVIYEDNPTYPNLIGRIENVAYFGTMVTDFTLIQPGALHRANGGYLIVDMIKILMQPYAWEALKRMLYSQRITTTPLGQLFGLSSTSTIEPQPIKLNVKVVLVGDRTIYHLLCAYDPDFRELFKVVADFEERIDRNADNNLIFAQLIAAIARKESLRPVHREAVARIIDHSARKDGDAKKLSTHMRSLTDLLCEANYWAQENNNQTILVTDVQQAIDTQIARLDRVRSQLYEEIERNTLIIDTVGEKIGQINGISVIRLGDFMFGQPSRITAVVRIGKGDVVDIEREVELGGALHSKGVLILSGYLGERYAKDEALSLHASLVFEQTYSGVEGDSASCAELCALLSALAETPLKQSLAITGSLDQHGQVQAIGGINEKIEGFFDVCKTRSLTGQQGVLIPQANVQHLMLRHEVVEAVRKDKFHIYPISNVDEAMCLLTGVNAGERNKQGRFPKNSINDRVEKRLHAFAAPKSSKRKH